MITTCIANIPSTLDIWNPCNKYCYFYSDWPFSQWSKTPFEYRGITFNCNEQWMMHQKAKLFKDEETAEKILATESPREQKKLGRQVKNFDKEMWESNCIAIVTLGQFIKFGDDKKAMTALKETCGSLLVEASPYDKIWGIGISEHFAASGAEWKGTNWLGQCLTFVRLEFFGA